MNDNTKKITLNDIYQKITDRILDELSKGKIPWENPIRNGCRPQNLLTGHTYKGVNVFLLSSSDTPYFMTFKQANEIGAKVKKGSIGFSVIFWDVYSKDNTQINQSEDVPEEENKKLRFVLKCYTVFKITDIEGIPEKHLPKTQNNENKIIPKAEEIINAYLINNGPTLHHQNSIPCYIPSCDMVRLPSIKYFTSENEYYSTLNHEIVHSSGMHSRLNRFDKEYNSFRFGSETYAKEELIAELGASFLMAESNQSINIKNRSAYIQNWLQALSNDNKMIIQAASKAEQAVNFILNRKTC